jgi:hypothetical protein
MYLMLTVGVDNTAKSLAPYSASAGKSTKFQGKEHLYSI